MTAAPAVTPPATSAWADARDPHKVCAWPGCGKLFGRTRYASGTRESPREFAARRFCSRACAMAGRNAGRPRKPKPEPKPRAFPLADVPVIGLAPAKPLPPGLPWEAYATCGRADPRWFFGPDGERARDRAVREAAARALCAVCPVRSECRRFARENGQEFGVWGGQGEDERRQEWARNVRSVMRAA